MVPSCSRQEGTRKAYNIIDGQQRITTFILLVNLLERILNKPLHFSATKNMQLLQTWVSRGEEQLKLERYLEFLTNPQDNLSKTVTNNRYLQNHFLLENLLDEYFKPEEKDESNPPLDKLYDFITKKNKIRFVVIETHAGLSKTLKIFNTINTSGLSLGTEDVFKIRFYEYLKRRGKPESVFDEISEIYAKIEGHNRNPENSQKFDMGNILSTCQRVIIAREKLNDATFSLSYGTFFERLFDTLLNIRCWPGFETLCGKSVLEIEDLNDIIKCYKENFDLYQRDYHFRIIRDMIGETRYGYIWDLPIIARFFNYIQKEQIFDYTEKLFKFLCPPSLFWAKAIYGVRSTLVDVLKRIPQNDDSEWFTVNVSYYDKKPSDMLDEAFLYEIAWYPKWKNLICRLVEYLKSPDKGKTLYDRLWYRRGIDIEHIQCYTDEKDPDGVREKWGKELNRLGNLALLESECNKSINNHPDRKPAAYAKSQFVSIRELEGRVASWTKEDAENRRKENSALLKEYLLKL